MDKRFQSVEAMIRLWVLEEEESQRESSRTLFFLKPYVDAAARSSREPKEE